MKTKNILITGGCGFIGSNLVLHLAKKYPNYKLINLDLMTYASDASYLKTLKDNPNYVFVKGDIRDEKLVNKLFDEHNIDSSIVVLVQKGTRPFEITNLILAAESPRCCCGLEGSGGTARLETRNQIDC